MCDHGIADDVCGVVPVRKSSLQVGYDGLGSTCNQTITFHRCDKRGFLNDKGQRFRCDPVYQERVVKIDSNRGKRGPCAPLSRVAYRDVVRCKSVRDNNIDVGCDLQIN